VPAAAVLAALAAGAWLAGRGTPPRLLAGLARALEHRRAPLAAALVAALACAAYWGSLDAVPLIHDEAAYLLQARIFARGEWAAPAPPLPEFFEQFHVFVEPVLAPKYPPGHALLLVPGVWLGLPGLVPVLLNGLTGGLLFALARRVGSPAVALLAFLLWLVAPLSLAFRASYFAQVSCGFLVLAAWWSLLEWQASGRARWLAAASAAVAWGAIARPLTLLALALPMAVFVLRRLYAARRWRELVPAGAVALAVLALMPVHSAHVTGDWRVTPYAHYSQVYFPFNVMGFGLKDGESSRDLPPDMRHFRQAFGPVHAAHTLEGLPRALGARTFRFLKGALGPAWIALLPLLVVGAARGSARVRFALASTALLLLAYLAFAHPADWTVYYLEAQPVVAVAAALGVLHVGRAWLARAAGGAAPARELFLVLALAAALAPFARESIVRIRGNARAFGARQQAFRALLAQAPERVLVFVRYGSGHDINQSLIVNVPDLAAARAVVVHDRGADNARLLPHFPGRKPYLFDEAAWELLPMDPRTGAVEERLPRGG
jgi:hypothetical protein